MTELKLNCTLYFDVPDGVTPEQYVKHLQDLTTRGMLRKATDLGTCYDWEWADENYEWQPV